MRTTLNLDDDLLAAAQSLARHQQISLGAAVGKLMRRGLQAPVTYATDQEDGDLPTFQVSESARPITLEHVRRAEDEA